MRTTRVVSFMKHGVDLMFFVINNCLIILLSIYIIVSLVM